jgi:hypothetical protein
MRELNMIEFDLRDFVKWLPDRKIAGAYVNGKWAKSSHNHYYIIKNIGLKPSDDKRKRLNDIKCQKAFYKLMKDWLQGRGSELSSFSNFKSCLQNIFKDKKLVQTLSQLTIENYSDDKHKETIINVWKHSCNIVNTKAKLVAVSKFLHHIFPLLFVPVDRKHTEKFIRFCSDYDKKTLNFTNPKELIRLLNFFRLIRKSSNNKLRYSPSNLYCDTSDTKTIDNWIVMWVDLKMNERNKLF